MEMELAYYVKTLRDDVADGKRALTVDRVEVINRI